MILTIHQPEHMPWLGFFHKLDQVDLCVILDNVQYRQRYFQNRNKIRNNNGWNWITVPVNANRSSLIKDVTIASDHIWKRKWIKTIEHAYRKAPYADLYLQGVLAVILQEWDKLSNLNIALIELLCSYLGIKTRFCLASEMKLEGKGSELILNICSVMGGATYLSGISGKDYLQVSDFTEAGIEVIFQEFHHPIYKQLYEPFEPCMSVIDLLLNHGPASLEIIRGIGVPVMEELFL
jgi:hypothetical protein